LRNSAHGQHNHQAGVLTKPSPSICFQSLARPPRTFIVIGRLRTIGRNWTRSCRMRPAAIGESISAPGCRISAAAQRGSIGGAGACSLAAPASRLALPLSHTKQHCNPPEKEPKALKRMFLRIHERSGGEPHCHPDCDGHPTSPAQRRPIAQANFRSEPVPRAIVHGAMCCELTCLSSAGHAG
jgi:hypothetical protein